VVGSPNSPRDSPNTKGESSLRVGRKVKLRPIRVRRPQLTGRNMMITAMALFLVVVLASPLQTYLNRRDSLAAARRQQQQLSQQVVQLQHQSDQWNDPAFVEREARIRLQYVRPGDTLYTVLNADGTARAASKPGSETTQRSAHQPSWSSTLWSSVQEADDRQ
jgi:cell division protein FtsB